MKTVFFGTPDFACYSLKALLDNDYAIEMVVTQPDKVQGRKRILTPPPVKVLATSNNLNVTQPVSAAEPEFIQMIKEIKPEIIIVIAYGQILKKVLLEIPKYGCVNVHGSLLPNYRGPSPIQGAIMNGDKVTGITIMKLDTGMDTGPILYQKEIEIQQGETAGELHDRMASIGAQTLVKGLDLYRKGVIEPIPQDHSKGTYTKLLTSTSGEIIWNKSSEDINNLIRAMNPWPSAYTLLNGTRIKIVKSEIFNKDTVGNNPGQVIDFIDGYPLIQCGLGSIIMKQVKPENKSSISGKDMVNGFRLKRGDFFC